MSWLRIAVASLALLCATAFAQAIATREEALDKLSDPAATRRAEAVMWFVRNGTAADDVQLLPRLWDETESVRVIAEQGVWVLWSRSGDKEVDALMEKGARQMQSRQLKEAIATYSDVIRLRPDFVEGWNKRATVLFLSGELKASLADCDEVLKRNNYHFGALSGYGQIHFQMKQYDQAIAYWRRALQVNPNLVLWGNIEAAQKLLAESRKRSA